MARRATSCSSRSRSTAGAPTSRMACARSARKSSARPPTGWGLRFSSRGRGSLSRTRSPAPCARPAAPTCGPRRSAPMPADLTLPRCASLAFKANPAPMTSHAVRKPEPRPEILAIDPYVPGKSRVKGLDKVHKLSSNESPLGPSPKAVEAVRALAGRLEFYPDGASTELREAIGARYGLDPARIICGNGSDELLSLLAHVFIHPGDEGLYSQYGFLTYPICIRAAGGVPVVAEERDRTASVDAMLAKASDRTKIVYLANPNNPTGTYIPFSEVKRLHAGLPPHTLMVIDAAYAEYVSRNDYAAGAELA